MSKYGWLKDKSVLITGASGFIGSALASELISVGAKVHVLSQTVDMKRPLFGGPYSERPLARDVERVIHGDLISVYQCQHAVTVSEPEFIFHLGALTQVTEAAKMPDYAFMVNAIGTLNILEAVRRLGITDTKTICASSDKAYGEPDPKDLPLWEDAMLNPVHPYDVSKACADIVARSYARYYDLRIQVTRLANVYGPGDTNWKRLIPGMCRWVLEGNTPIIRSDGKQVRQYLFIEDAVRAYLDLAFRMATEPTLENGQAFNFAPDMQFQVMEVVEAIVDVAKEMGHEALEPRILNEAKDETPALALDSFQAKNQLDWNAETDFHDGLQRTIKWVTLYLKEMEGGMQWLGTMAN